MKTLIHALILFSISWYLMASPAMNLPDPTRPDAVTKKVVKKKQKSRKQIADEIQKKRIKSLRLQQTVVSENLKYAVINGRRFEKGDKVNGMLVWTINREYVILMNNGQRHVLKLLKPVGIKEAIR